MLIALLSDIHGNLAALRAVMADMKSMNVSRAVCLGDVVGYGPHPLECLDLVAGCRAILMGNHEEALVGESEAFNPRAKSAIDWTREQLHSQGSASDQKRRQALLASLKTNVAFGDKYQFYHASPRQPTREYVLPKDIEKPDKIDDIFSLIRHICFVGHTHIPGVFHEDHTFTPQRSLMGNTYSIKDGRKALINVGSIGQPRDGDLRACYALLDDNPASPMVIYRRVPYDVETTALAIEANPHLDDALAVRLRHGR
ncbi:MAG: metallophosphoesterase family protein [Planctomycetota bacterium]|jgi:diadenosine tetraphosphatase ApaH/serine/threonine PP2A family protein phosphatase